MSSPRGYSTGKTVTLKVLAEQLRKQEFLYSYQILAYFSKPCEKGEVTEKIAERFGKSSWYTEPSSYPVAFWMSWGNGINIRTTISEMGPILLAQLLGLNET